MDAIDIILFSDLFLGPNCDINTTIEKTCDSDINTLVQYFLPMAALYVISNYSFNKSSIID